MKKFVILLLAFVLAGISSANAIEITSGMQDVDRHSVATNGKNHAVVWTTYNYDQDSSVVYASVKRGSGNWQTPAILASTSGYIYPEIEILDNGKVLVFVIMDNQLLVSSTSKTGKNFSSISEVTGTQNYNFSNSSDLTVHGNGNNLTLVTVANVNNVPGVYTLDLKANSTSWVIKKVMDGYPQTQMSGCDLDEELCYINYGVTISSNAKNQQTITVSMNLNNRTSEDNYETYVLFETQRKSLSSNWQSAQAIDRYGPAIIEGYSFWIKSNITTPKGKSVISWVKGFNDNPPRGYISVSKSFGKPFTASDTAALSKGVFSQAADLVAEGEKVTAVFQRGTGDFSSVIYTGIVGNLDKAKKFESETPWIHGLFKVNGKLRLVTFRPEEDGSATPLIATSKNGNWTGQTPLITSSSEDLNLEGWNLSLDASSTSLIASSPNANIEEEIYGLGLELVVVK